MRDGQWNLQAVSPFTDTNTYKPYRTLTSVAPKMRRVAGFGLSMLKVYIQ